MTSGTTDKVKLCAYTGENFYYQICDSVNIIEQCPQIKRHYQGQLKQLVLLPFYHVFGFIAVYLWFGFFSRTFVFPKNLDPITIQNTVKKHKVTHIFAVPMVWDAVYKAAISKIKSRGDKTYRKFEKMIGITNALDGVGDILAKRFLSEVREGLFGDSICFLVSGGSHIQPNTLRFFNGIGYHLANGYGMTEIGIASLEKSNSKKILNSGSVGAPFGYCEYRVGDGGELQCRGKTMASRIIKDGKNIIVDFDQWFSTGDLVKTNGSCYYIQGRTDDLIIGDDGENINPVIAESCIKVDGIDNLCLIKYNGTPALIVGVSGCFSAEKLKETSEKIENRLLQAKLDKVVKKIYFTTDPLMEKNEFKLSRTKIAKRIESGNVKVFDPRGIDEHIKKLLSGLEQQMCECFAQALGIEAQNIGVNDNFFRDLGGTSIDYFSLIEIVKQRFGVEIPYAQDNKFATVREFCDYINN